MLGLADQQQHSRAIFTESLEVLIGLWENETFSYHGEYYQIDNVTLTPRPVQKPRPPIYVAAISPESFALVEKYGLNIMVTPDADVAARAEGERHRREEAADQGRPFAGVAELPDELADASRADPRGGGAAAGRVARLVLQPRDGARAEGPERAEGLRVHARPGRRVRAGRGRVGAGAAGGRDHHPRRSGRHRRRRSARFATTSASRRCSAGCASAGCRTRASAPR